MTSLTWLGAVTSPWQPQSPMPIPTGLTTPPDSPRPTTTSCASTTAGSPSLPQPPVLKALRNAYPNKFKSLRPVFFVSPAFAEAWGEELATRNTALGDRVIENGGVLPYFGYRLYVDPYLEKDGNISEKALFTLPDNLVFGIQRAISFDAEWVPRRRAFEITITARNDFEIVTPEPVALGTGVPQF